LRLLVRLAAQIKAFGDTWQWDQAAAKTYQKVVEASGSWVGLDGSIQQSVLDGFGKVFGFDVVDIGEVGNSAGEF